MDNVLHINDYTPFIHEFEIDRLVEDFKSFGKEFIIVQDSTCLYDEQSRICSRSMDDEGLWL